MTIADLLRPADRQRLERLADDDDGERERELAVLDRLMRRPGTLASVPEPPPLHRAGHRNRNRDGEGER